MIKQIKPKHKKIIIAWLLIFPALSFRLITSIYPMIQTIIFSFYDFRGSMRNMEFGGLINYSRIPNDIGIQMALEFSVIFTVVSTLCIIVLGYIVAILLNQKFKGKKFLRSIVLIPWAIPGIVLGIAASWAFHDAFGFINDIISRLFIPGFNTAWLVDVNRARFAVIAVDVWKNVPFFAILILAGLQNTSEDVLESAKIDGAGPITIFFKIILPGLKKITITLTIFFILWRLTQFDLVFAMTRGGPGAATSLISHRVMLEAFSNLNFGYASAISVLLFVIMIVVASIGIGAQKLMDR